MATALRTDSKNSLRLMRPPARLRQTLLLPQRLCMRVYRVLSQNIDFFRVFFSGYGKQQALQLGRMWEGLKDPKMLSEALNECEKSRKKAKYAVFCGSDKVAGKLERGRHMAVLNLFHFHEFSDLILLKTWNISLEISSDFKHCPWFEVDSVVDLGHFVKSQCFQHFTGVTHWVSYQDIHKMPSNSKKGLVL